MKPEYPFKTQIFEILGRFGHIQVVNTTPGRNLKFLKCDSIGRSRFLLALSFYGLFYFQGVVRRAALLFYAFFNTQI